MKTKFKTTIKNQPAAIALLVCVSFIATLAMTASAEMNTDHPASYHATTHATPLVKMETINVNASRMPTEKMATIVVSVPRLAHVSVARTAELNTQPSM